MCIRDRFWNYDSSEFDSVSALSSDDSELEATWKKEHSLEAFLAKDQFKSFEDLERRLSFVLGTAKRAAVSTVDTEEYEPVKAPEQSSFRAKVSANIPVKEESIVEDDDALSYFRQLAEE